MRYVSNSLSWKPEGKKPFGRPRRRWGIIWKRILKKRRELDSSDSRQKHGNQSSGFIKRRELLDRLNEYQLLPHRLRTPNIIKLLADWYGFFLGFGRFFSFLILYTKSVGLLGRGISPSQGRYLHIEQHKHSINAHNKDIHASSGIPIHDPSVRASEDSLCLTREWSDPTGRNLPWFFFSLQEYTQQNPLSKF
jgi:hypothetical protein